MQREIDILYEGESVKVRGSKDSHPDSYISWELGDLTIRGAKEAMIKLLEEIAYKVGYDLEEVQK